MALFGETPAQLNVLVVDDDPEARELLVHLVTEAGHQAVQAESAEEILQLLPFWEFEVAFIDNRLTGMNGIVLGEYLRRTDPEITLALVTGDPDPSTAEKCQELGIRLIPKPFSVVDIRAVMSEAAESSGKRSSRPTEPPDYGEYALPIADHIEGVIADFDIPGVPDRIATRLTVTIKTALNHLRSPSRFNESDRVTALLGLLTAKTLGLRLPKSSSGHTLYEEYDQLMRGHRRRPEFAKRRDTENE